MPDNTWFTPYILPNKDCLSIAASQGVAYRLSEHHVLKMPYQYPVKDVESFDLDEAIEQLELSQGSIDSFNDERAFYRLLETTGQHPDIVKVDHSTLEHGIVLEYLQPLEIAWVASTETSRLRWIKQLLRATAKIEELGYTHGDLAVRNMGVDKNNDLKLFDFGSVHQLGDEYSHRFIEKDLSRLADCIHFLLSGKDPLADIPDRKTLRQVQAALENGTFAIDTLARPVEDILRSCWAKNLAVFGNVSQSMIFSHVGQVIGQALDVKDDSVATHEVLLGQPPERPVGEPDFTSLAFDANQYDLTRDPRWMAEEEYREAWRRMGVTV